MTDQQIAQWKKDRDIARAIENEHDRTIALQAIYDQRDEMQMTCIAHQSKRQKEMIVDIKNLQDDMGEVKGDLIPLKATNKNIHDWRERIKGAKFVLTILKALGLLGVGAGVAKVNWASLLQSF